MKYLLRFRNRHPVPGPFRIWRKFRHELGRAYWKRKFTLAGTVFGAGVQIYGAPIITVYRGSKIRVGDRAVICSSSEKTALGVSRPTVLRTLNADATILIGDDTGLSGTVVCAAIGVEIGDRCLVGADVTIVDTDFHPVAPWRDRRYAARPEAKESDRIVIGSDVFIGTQSIILKGVTIGDGAVVGAGSVVTANVPATTIVAGNPARTIGSVS